MPDYEEQDLSGALNSAVYSGAVPQPQAAGFRPDPFTEGMRYADQSRLYDEMLGQRQRMGALAEQVAQEKYNEYRQGAELRKYLSENKLANAKAEKWARLYEALDLSEVPEEQRPMEYKRRLRYIRANNLDPEGEVDPEYVPGEHEQSLEAVKPIVDTWYRLNPSIVQPTRMKLEESSRLQDAKAREGVFDEDSRALEAVLTARGWNEQNIYDESGQLRPQYLDDYRMLADPAMRKAYIEQMNKKGAPEKEHGMDVLGSDGRYYRLVPGESLPKGVTKYSEPKEEKKSTIDSQFLRVKGDLDQLYSRRAGIEKGYDIWTGQAIPQSNIETAKASIQKQIDATERMMRDYWPDEAARYLERQEMPTAARRSHVGKTVNDLFNEARRQADPEAGMKYLMDEYGYSHEQARDILNVGKVK